MKVIQKIRKALIGIVAFLSLLPAKVLAIRDSMMAVDPAYGIEKPDTIRNNLNNDIWNICRMFVIPIALLIGIIVYLKKSKSNMKRKIITILITLGLVVILYFIIDGV